MRFEVCDPTKAVSLLAWRSTQGKFVFGFNRVAYGIRVVISGDRFYHVNYCIGTNLVDALVVFGVVRLLVQSIDESTPDAHLQIERLFPLQKRKPMNHDPDLYEELKRLGDAALKDGQKAEWFDGLMLACQLRTAFNRSSDGLVDVLDGHLALIKI
jgi:hypothetical protein